MQLSERRKKLEPAMCKDARECGRLLDSELWDYSEIQGQEIVKKSCDSGGCRWT